jgi:hypothetical protein
MEKVAIKRITCLHSFLTNPFYFLSFKEKSNLAIGNNEPEKELQQPMHEHVNTKAVCHTVVMKKLPLAGKVFRNQSDISPKRFLTP